MTEQEILSIILRFMGPKDRGRIMRHTAAYISHHVGEQNASPLIVNDLLKLALAYENQREDEIESLGNALAHRMEGIDPWLPPEERAREKMKAIHRPAPAPPKQGIFNLRQLGGD